MNNTAKLAMVEIVKTLSTEGRGTETANAGINSAVPGSQNSESSPLISCTILKRLALSESGFVFDPVSGQSFTVNESGLAVLRLAQVEEDVTKLVENLALHFDATTAEIRRDVLDYADRLKEFLK
jgi:hypothetical protein